MNDYRFRPPIERAMNRPPPASGDDGDTIQLGLTEYSSAHQLLKAIYLDDAQPLGRRMRAAIAALPFEVPKLTASSGSGGIRDFASQLEAARKRSGRPVVIEHQPQETESAETVPVMASGPSPGEVG
jgi:hypothetical protein